MSSYVLARSSSHTGTVYSLRASRLVQVKAMLRAADNDEFSHDTLKSGSSEGLVKHGTFVWQAIARDTIHVSLNSLALVGLRGGWPALQALHSGWLGWIAPWGWAALLSSDEDSSNTAHGHDHQSANSHHKDKKIRHVGGKGHRSDKRPEPTNREVGARAAAGAPTAADPFNAFNQPANERFPLLSKYGAPTLDSSHVHSVPSPEWPFAEIRLLLCGEVVSAVCGALHWDDRRPSSQ